MTKKYHRVKDHYHYTGGYRGAAHNICNLRYKIPEEIPLVFQNGYTYDHHFMIKELVEEFEGQFECLEENKEKHINFSVAIKKELDSSKIITNKIKFRFMSSLLPNLVDNLYEVFHIDKCMDCKSCLSYIVFKDDQLIFRCFECKKNY